jgi:hypothetical protein
MPVEPSLEQQGKGLSLLSLGELLFSQGALLTTCQTDAGGARGLSQLKILSELTHRMKFETQDDLLERPCAIFDMIGGSGSGG